MHLRLLACTAFVAMAALAAPGLAWASSTQLSLIQDDRELLGEAGEDPGEAMAEIRALGVDVVRTNVVYNKIYRFPGQRRKPAAFNASDHNSSFYDFSKTDQLVNLARANGMQVLLTVTGPGPFFTSSSPSRCRRQPCSHRPKPGDFGKFAAAVARRYRGRVDFYSVWNEPNIGKTWLTPRFRRTRFGRVDAAGALYRKLFIAGQRAIAANDPPKRNRVLFGETAAIASPLPMLRAALCLDPNGRPFTGPLKALHGCSGRVKKLNVLGFAIHPYNQGGYGSPRSRTRTKSTLPLAYLPRLHRLMDGAARRGRIGGGKGIYITEFGFQTRPPDPFGVSPTNQAVFMNESDRLFFADRRVKTVAQYELTDVPQRDQFNTGLRFVRSSGATQKPSYAAYRTPIVVTRRSANSVEVYGQVRPSRTFSSGPNTSVVIQAVGGAAFTKVVPTNGRGIFRTVVNRAGAAALRWRVGWRNPDTGGLFASRIATAGKRLRYYRN